MNEVAIFIYGVVVFAIVSAACWLIVWGIIQERRDREQLEADQAGAPEQPPVGTGSSGATLPRGGGA